MGELKVARVALGISQYELAKRSGISRTMIHNMESGKRNPTLITAHALAHALDVDFSKLVEKSQDIPALVRHPVVSSHERGQVADCGFQD